MKRYAVWVLAFALLMLPAMALADSYSVYVGYADSLRGLPNFPSIWQGDAGVTFVGSGAPWDAGAVMIQNNSATDSLTVNDITVDIPCPGCAGGVATFDLWGSNTIAPNSYLIVTQTLGDPIYNFDTSDFSGLGCVGAPGDGGIPTVSVTTGGGSPTTTNYSDTGQVLNTGGFDLALCGTNEALGWRLIGTTGINNPGNQLAPEPASLVLFGTGLLGIGSKAWKRFIG